MTARRTLGNPRRARRRAPAPGADATRVLAEAKETLRLARAAVAELRRIAAAQLRMAESQAELVREIRASCTTSAGPAARHLDLNPEPAPRWRRWLRALRWR